MAGPLGIEQSFTITRRPAAQNGSLILALRLGGGLRPVLAGSQVRFVTSTGRVSERYGGLVAIDARGQRLAASLGLTGSLLMLRIADRGAAYPLRIDPLIEQQKIASRDRQGPSTFADSVALSSNGSIALIGGPDNGCGCSGGAGAVWVYKRAGGTWTKQQKIVPNDEIPNSAQFLASFGASVALSSDGSIALIGGSGDGDVGAVWVYKRSGSGWTEQQKIIPADLGAAVSAHHFGASVALSSDASTALIGSTDDGLGAGATWVYTRSGTTWSEQQKVVPQDESYTAAFGSSVALSSDGGTALIGGPYDGTGGADTGAAWLYRRPAGMWTEQQKIVPQDERKGGTAEFGTSVGLSSDGSTALVGGQRDRATGQGKGTAWVYTSAGGAWTEQKEIVPDDATGGAGYGVLFGSGVALSSDGSTALIGGPGDGQCPGAFNLCVGAAWVYRRSGTAWSEQQRIVPRDERVVSAFGGSGFGSSVALSSDGRTALIGGPWDGGNAGAAWLYRPGGVAGPPRRRSLPTIYTGLRYSMRPHIIACEQAAGGQLSLRWSSWGKTRATATGTSTVEHMGVVRRAHVTVVAFRPEQGHFTRLRITFIHGASLTDHLIPGTMIWG